MRGASSEPETEIRYRGRIAPTPTGHLHLGHARAFGVAWARARAAGGSLIYRTEDLDPQRCREDFAADAIEDLRWLGLAWDEGPDVAGPFGPYVQSARHEWFLQVWAQLRDAGTIYPSPHSRKDVAAASQAPNEGDAEFIFPPELRPSIGCGAEARTPGVVNWRFRVPDGRRVTFTDAFQGAQTFTAGIDFGDFLVWRRDGVPAYEMAVVADDHAMRITEVVRGADLLISTARQILIYEALGWHVPKWCHVPLLRDAQGRRLAKRHASLSLRMLRATGQNPEALRTAQIQPEWIHQGSK